MRQCGHPRCTKLMPSRQFACSEHWAQVPWELRKRQIQAAGISTAEHTAALRTIELYWLEEERDR